jgi:PAS domain S-box-containing protein
MESQPATCTGQQTLFVEQVPAAIAMFDAEMRYMAVSRRYLSDMASLFSTKVFAPADVVGRSHYETFPGMPLRWRSIHARVLAGEELAQEEDFIRRADGPAAWVRWFMKPWRASDGGLGGALLFFETITAEIEAKHALVESKEQFRATFENAAIGIAHLGSDLRWLRANEALCRILGWPIEELLTKSLHDISHPDDLAADLAHIEQMRAGKIDSYAMDKRYLRMDGTIAWGRLTVGCVRRSDGPINYFVAVVEDIYARKRVEELLQRQADLLNQSHDAIFTWKIGGGITYWNRGAEILYGYPHEEAIGRRSHDLLKTRAHISMQDVEVQIAQQGSWYGELTHTTRDGQEITVESRHVRVKYDGELYALETNRDITARKRAEEQVDLLMREANHRVKNLLGLVQAIARQTAAGSPQDFIGRFTERIQALAANQNLLGRNQQQGAGLEDLVRAQLAHFADLVGSRIAVGGPKLRLNAAAAQAIGLALHELATNAAKHGALSTDAGRVDISWRAADDTFTIRWTEQGGPLVAPPEQRGFGTTVMEAMAERSLDGAVDLNYQPSGLTWRLTCPAANAVQPGSHLSNAEP